MPSKVAHNAKHHGRRKKGSKVRRRLHNLRKEKK